MRPLRSVLLLFRFPPDFAGGGLQASRLMEQLGRHGVEMQALSQIAEDGRGAPQENAYGGRVRRFRVFGGIWSRDILLSLRAAWWLITHRDWDLLHCSGFSYFGVLPVWVAKWRRKPVLIKTTVLGKNGAFNPGGTRIAKLLLGTYAHADVIVALSQALEDDLRSQSRVRAEILQIPNGVDTERFHPARGDERARARQRFGLPADAFVIASVAMLYPRKNVVALVRAAARMKTRPVCVALAGPPGPDPAYLAELDREIAALPEGVTARILGSLDADALAELQRGSDLFALLSRAEGLPNALLEAMSSGLACVASDIPGAADVLRDGGGVLVPLDDDEGLAATLDGIAGSPEEQRRLGEEARRLIEERYAFDRIAQRYRAVYEAMLAGRPAGEAAAGD